MSLLASLLDNIDVVIVATGALVGVAASLLGTFLVLRRSSLLSDAISHSILLGIMLVWLATGQTSGPLQIIGAGLTGVATVWLSELLYRSGRVKYDAAIGLVFPALFAIGVLLANLYARDVHIDEDVVLLGEIGFVWLDTVPLAGLEVPTALLSLGVLTAINLLFVIVFYKELKIATFDPALAVALGFAPGVLHYALLGLTSATAVASFDAVGAILFIAFVIVPPATGYLLTDRLWKMIGYGVLVSVASSVLGYLLAVRLDVAIGGAMASMTGVFLMLAFLLSPRYGLLARELRRTDQRRDQASRALVVHLYNHEGSPEARRENLVSALGDHLRWSPAKADRVLLRSLDRNLVARDGDRLRLTPKGRASAQEVVEPWRQSESPESAGGAQVRG